MNLSVTHRVRFSAFIEKFSRKKKEPYTNRKTYVIQSMREFVQQLTSPVRKHTHTHTEMYEELRSPYSQGRTYGRTYDSADRQKKKKLK